MATKRIKIAHIITRMDRGGAPDILRILFEQLSPESFDLTLIYGPTRQPSQKCLDFLKKLGDRAILVSALRRDINLFLDIAALLTLLKILRQGRFDIVHTHTAKAGVLGRIAARLVGVRSVIHSPHGHDFYGYFGRLGSGLVVWAERFAGLFCDRIHVLTQLERKDHIAFGICGPGKLEVIHSGIEMDFLRPPPNIVDKAVAKVGMVSRLEQVKGPRYFIEAASRVSRQRHDVVFLVVGEGRLRRDMERRVAALGLSGRFEFTGWREDVQSVLFDLDILVLPSLNEAVGRSLLEAQAAGVPVVASRVGGVPEVVKDGVTGILVPPADADALARAILDLLNDGEKRRKMAQAARGWVDERFSDRVMAEKFAQLYKQLAANRPHRYKQT